VILKIFILTITLSTLTILGLLFNPTELYGNKNGHEQFNIHNSTNIKKMSFAEVTRDTIQFATLENEIVIWHNFQKSTSGANILSFTLIAQSLMPGTYIRSNGSLNSLT